MDEIKNLLKKDYEAKFEFETLLLEAGYLEEVEVEYLDFGFQIFSEPKIYHVDDDFPKISNESIPKEIKKVEYIINLQNQVDIQVSINDLIVIE